MVPGCKGETQLNQIAGGGQEEEKFCGGHMHLGFLSPAILQGVLQLVQRSAGRVETGDWH